MTVDRAQQLGEQFCREHFPGHQALVCTHPDGHNHSGNIHKRRQREISFEYLTEEKFYPFSTTDKYFSDPCKQYPVMICGQRVIFTNGELAEALSALPEKKREIIYLYFFGHYTQQEIGELYGRCRSTAWHHIHSALQMLHIEMEVLFHEKS